jgi:hypothetical protein
VQGEIIAYTSGSKMFLFAEHLNVMVLCIEYQKNVFLCTHSNYEKVACRYYDGPSYYDMYISTNNKFKSKQQQQSLFNVMINLMAKMFDNRCNI